MRSARAHTGITGRDRSTPIHQSLCSEECWWSTDNAGEALPGVITPLTWTFFADPLERAMKGTFYDMGVYRRSEVVASPDAESRLMDIFYGRAAGNLNTFRDIGERTPGTSGNAIEEQIFGSVRPGMTSRPVYSRYPFVALRAPVNASLLVRRLTAATGGIRPWWEAKVAAGGLGSIAEARAAFLETNARFEHVMRPHTLAAMLCQALYDQLHQIAEAAGHPGLELRLVTGYGDMAETEVVSDLWAVSRDRLELDEFVSRHGFHGPCEGELSSRVWRIRRDPLDALVRAYRDMGDERDPRAIEAERGNERRRAESELLGGLSSLGRARAKVVLRIAARFIPLRGVGKAAFLQCVDVGRAAARLIGEDMAERRQLADPEDVFMLTAAELAAEPPADVLELTQRRRAKHTEYLGLDIPPHFSGVPVPFPIAEAQEREDPGGTVVTGAAVSPGVVEGVARVILDPNEAELEPGEILVCRMTDPSWASTMMLASALVIDTGGPISHGAIVARELGIPCVIGTRDGTASIRTGDLLRVDGQSGEVLVMEAAV